jgi:hypothetical protein
VLAGIVSGNFSTALIAKTVTVVINVDYGNSAGAAYVTIRIVAIVVGMRYLGSIALVTANVALGIAIAGVLVSKR